MKYVKRIIPIFLSIILLVSYLTPVKAAGEQIIMNELIQAIFAGVGVSAANGNYKELVEQSSTSFAKHLETKYQTGNIMEGGLLGNLAKMGAVVKVMTYGDKTYFDLTGIWDDVCEWFRDTFVTNGSALTFTGAVSSVSSLSSNRLYFSKGQTFNARAVLGPYIASIIYKGDFSGYTYNFGDRYIRITNTAVTAYDGAHTWTYTLPKPLSSYYDKGYDDYYIFMKPYFVHKPNPANDDGLRLPFTALPLDVLNAPLTGAAYDNTFRVGNVWLRGIDNIGQGYGLGVQSSPDVTQPWVNEIGQKMYFYTDTIGFGQRIENVDGTIDVIDGSIGSVTRWWERDIVGNDGYVDDIPISVAGDYVDVATGTISGTAEGEDEGTGTTIVVLPHPLDWTKPIEGNPEDVRTDAIPGDIATDIPDTNTTDETSNKYKAPNLILTKFPFCLPWDLYSAFRMLLQPRKLPKFDLNFTIASAGISAPLQIDLTVVEPLVNIFRWFMGALFVIFLILITRNIIKG